MIALPAKQRIRKLYLGGHPAKEIERITGHRSWIVKPLVNRWEAYKLRRRLSAKRTERKRKATRKMLQTNLGHLSALGMRVLREPKRCECGKLTKIASKHRTQVTCFECVVAEVKETTKAVGV